MDEREGEDKRVLKRIGEESKGIRKSQGEMKRNRRAGEYNRRNE